MTSSNLLKANFYAFWNSSLRFKTWEDRAKVGERTKEQEELRKKEEGERKRRGREKKSDSALFTGVLCPEKRHFPTIM